MKTTHDRRQRAEADKAVPRGINPLTRIPAAVREEMREKNRELAAFVKKVKAIPR